MLVPRPVLERVGLLDDELFLYVEDTEWSLRARAAGYRLYVVPASARRAQGLGRVGRGGLAGDALLRPAQPARRCAERHAPLRGPDDGGGVRLRSARTWSQALAGRAAARGSGRRARGLARLPARAPRAARSPRVTRDPGLWLLLHLRPPGDRRGDSSGCCTVCGAETRFRLNSWGMAREVAAAFPDGFVRRECLLCSECGSSTRVRRLAEALLAHYADGATSIAELVEEPGFRSLRVAEINALGRMHAFLTRLPSLTYAEYPEEDIQRLSYPDASFDLVLTSDTLEHVPDPHAALRETRRVLRPGGRHVFTVPFDPGRERSRSVPGCRRSTTAAAPARSRS